MCNFLGFWLSIITTPEINQRSRKVFYVYILTLFNLYVMDRRWGSLAILYLPNKFWDFPRVDQRKNGSTWISIISAPAEWNSTNFGLRSLTFPLVSLLFEVGSIEHAGKEFSWKIGFYLWMITEGNLKRISGNFVDRISRLPGTSSDAEKIGH